MTTMLSVGPGVASSDTALPADAAGPPPGASIAADSVRREGGSTGDSGTNQTWTRSNQNYNAVVGQPSFSDALHAAQPSDDAKTGVSTPAKAGTKTSSKSTGISVSEAPTLIPFFAALVQPIAQGGTAAAASTPDATSTAVTASASLTAAIAVSARHSDVTQPGSPAATAPGDFSKSQTKVALAPSAVARTAERGHETAGGDTEADTAGAGEDNGKGTALAHATVDAHALQSSPAAVFSSSVSGSLPGTVGASTPTASSSVANSGVAERIAVVQQIATQISASHAAANSSQGTQTVTMNVQPEHWGAMKITLTMDAAKGSTSGVTATIVTSSDAIRDALSSQTKDLHQALESSGFKLDKLEIVTGTVASGVVAGAREATDLNSNTGSNQQNGQHAQHAASSSTDSSGQQQGQRSGQQFAAMSDGGDGRGQPNNGWLPSVQSDTTANADSVSAINGAGVTTSTASVTASGVNVLA